MAKLVDTIIPDFSRSEAKGQALIREWRKTKRPTPAATALRPGNLLFINYRGVTRGVYDENPCIMVLRTNKRYVLAFNVNWLPRRYKKKLLDMFAATKAHELNRLQMLNLFKKIRRLKWPKEAYRLYFKAVIKEHRIYNLDVGEFYQAVTSQIISKKMVK